MVFLSLHNVKDLTFNWKKKKKSLLHMFCHF